MDKRTPTHLTALQSTLARFRRASHLVHATHVLDEVLVRVIAELYSALDAEAASVAMLDQATGEIILNAAGPVAERISGLRLPPEHGILGWVISNRQSVIVNDVSSDARFWPDVDGLSGFQTRSILCAPLFSGPQVIGAIEVLNKRTGEFVADDLHFLEAFSAVAASAIENARRFREEKRRRREADALRQVWEALTTPRELDVLLSVILDQLAELVEYRSAAILFITDEKRLTMGASRGIDKSIQISDALEQLGIDEKIQTMLKTQQPLLIPDTRTDPRWQHLPGFAYIRSWIGAPLLVKGQLIGTLNVDHDRPNFYTADHARLLTSFAHQAAVAIENSRLYDATRKASMQLAEQARRMVSVYETSRALLGGLELDHAALGQLVQRITDLVNVRYGWLEILAGNGRPSTFITAGISASEKANLDLAAISDGLLAALSSECEVIRSSDLAAVEAPGPLPADLLHSFLGVAIHTRGRLLGRLLLAGKKDNRDFSDEDEALALALAAQIASAIDNAAMYNKVQRQLRELGALYEISCTLVRMTRPDDVYSLLAEQVANLLDAQRCAFFIFQDGQLECQSPAYGLPPKAIPFLSFSVSQDDPLYTVIHTADPLISNEALDDPELLSVQPALARFGIRRLLSCRIAIDEQKFGLFVVADKRGGEEFSEQDRHLASIIAHQVSSVLQRALLQSRQQQHLQIQSALMEVSQAISSLTDLDELLETVARITHQLVSCDHCIIAAWDEKLAAFVPRAHSGLDGEATQLLTHLRLAPGDLTFINRATQTRKAALLTHEEICTLEPRELQALMGLGGSLIVPLVAQERVVGLIIVGYAEGTRPPGENEIVLVGGIAQQAAVAVENTNLYRDLQLHAGRLERAYRELKSLDQRKTQFIQNVSHELRTPFTLVKGYLELLLDEEMGPLDDRQAEGLQVIADKMAELGRLIDDIVTIQSIDATSLDLYTFDLRILLQATLDNMRRSAPNIQFVSEFEDLPTLEADAGMLERAFKHLLDNAVKFSPNGGTITVRARRNGENILVEIEDQGIGISKESLPYIFDRFYQADGSTTRRFGGTGLGLSIVKQIIEAHGGQVGVRSTASVGSTFFLTLPLKPPPKEPWS